MIDYIRNRNGFILRSIEYLTNIWLLYFDVWSWAGVFHRIKKKRDKIYLQQNNVLHDIMWLFMLLFSFISNIIIEHQSVLIELSITSIAIWRVIDHFIDSIRLPIFGWLVKSNKSENLSLERTQRRILLMLVYMLELIFWYSVVYYVLIKYEIIKISTHNGHPVNIINSLYISFSNATTIGYGSFSPKNSIAIFVAMVQFFTSFLYLTVTISSLANFTKNNQILFKGRHPEYRQEFSSVKIKLRIIIPPFMTIMLIFTINIMLIASILNISYEIIRYLVLFYLPLILLVLITIGIIFMHYKKLK